MAGGEVSVWVEEGGSAGVEVFGREVGVDEDEEGEDEFDWRRAIRCLVVSGGWVS